MHIFSRLDADGDGKITKEEILKHHAKGDTDGDGAISREEFIKRAMKARQGHGRPGHAHRRPGTRSPSDRGRGDSKSRDGDKKPDARRRPVPGGPRFGRGGPPSRSSMFAHIDKNKDGKVTKDEAPEALWSRISKADSNGDGAVTKEELGAHMKKRFEEYRKKYQERSKSKKDEPKKDDKKTSVDGDDTQKVVTDATPEGSLSAHPPQVTLEETEQSEASEVSTDKETQAVQ